MMDPVRVAAVGIGWWSGEEGTSNVAVLEAIIESTRTGQAVCVTGA